MILILQEPVLFSGSLRTNLDPFEKATDDEIWTSLEHSQLKDFFKSQPEQLSFHCTEGGDNLRSVLIGTEVCELKLKIEN